MEYFHQPQKVPCAPLYSVPSAESLAISDMTSVPIVLLFPECHINVIMQYAAFYV